MEMKKYKLGELMEVTRGMSLSGEYYATEGRLIRLTLGNFDYRNNCFKDDKSKDNIYFTGDVKDEFVLNKDDIITPLTEQAIGLLGSTAKIPCDGKYIQSQDVGLIKCNEKLHPDFAFYVIPSKIVRTQLSATAQQTKIRHTSPDKIKNCTFWIPEYAEQEKIGNFIKSLDEKIALNRRINAKLEQMAKRLYDHWFVQFDFPRDVSATPQHDTKPYKASGGKMVWNETLKREIPQGWEVKRLGDLCVKGNTKPFDFSYEEKTIDLSIMPSDQIFLSTLNSSNNFTTNLFEMKKGDILFGSIRPYLHKAVLAPCNGVVAGTVHNFRVKNKDDYNFVAFTICNNKMFDYANSLSQGTKMPVVSFDTIMNYKIPYNKEIVSMFNKINILDTLSTNTLQQEKLTALRDRLLPLLMNGQVEVE